MDARERTLEQVQEAQRQVRHVRFTPEFEDAAAQLRRETPTAGLDGADRRWVELVRCCRAQARMRGRDHVFPEDLAVVEHGLWRDKIRCPRRTGSCWRSTGASSARPPKSVRRPRRRSPSSRRSGRSWRARPERGHRPGHAAQGDQRITAIKAVKAHVEAVLDEASREQRDAAGLRELLDELVSIQLWFKSNSLPYE